jgi:hypothetical protein
MLRIETDLPRGISMNLPSPQENRSTKRDWIAPSVRELSVRATGNVNGSDTDQQGGGIFLFQEPPQPPAGRWGAIPSGDKRRVLDFLQSISATPEKLDAAVKNPDDAMTAAGLTEDQSKIARGVLSHLGRRSIDD